MIPLLRHPAFIVALSLIVIVSATIGLVGASAIPGLTFLVVILAVFFGGFRIVTGPLPRIVGRLKYSIRWKVLGAIGILGAVSLVAVVANNFAMNYMHEELHRIQEIWFDPARARAELDALEQEQHGVVFSFLPFLSFLAALAAAAFGVAIAISVISPIRHMGETMRRIASGDLSQVVEVENQDELGELAARINETARELARLQETALADERAHALQERITFVAKAQEEERRRLSRELHDGLGPSLAAAANRLRACQSLIYSHPTLAETEIEDVSVFLRGQILDIRRLIYDLRPMALDQLGLVGALRQHLERFSRETGIHASLVSNGDTPLDSLTEVSIFRVVQECLSNVHKHADANQVELVLNTSSASIELVVRDNGCGFEQAGDYAGGGQGVGLLSIRERAELLHGSATVESSAGKGCVVTLRLPRRQVEVGAN